MATTDQNFTVYAAAQQVVSAFLQARNNSLAEAGNPLVAAMINLNMVLNTLPEYADPSTVLVAKFDGTVRYDLRNAAGGAISGSPKAGFYGNPAVPYLSLPGNFGCFQTGLTVALPANATVKGVLDATITKCIMTINTSGVLQSVALTV